VVVEKPGKRNAMQARKPAMALSAKLCSCAGAITSLLQKDHLTIEIFNVQVGHLVIEKMAVENSSERVRGYKPLEIGRGTAGRARKLTMQFITGAS
jgi:hypothetical protein